MHAVYLLILACFSLQEVQRIKKEHRDDASALVNDRVKGSLKVTRAFGAGFLKQVRMDILRFMTLFGLFCH